MKAAKRSIVITLSFFFFTIYNCPIVRAQNFHADTISLSTSKLLAKSIFLKRNMRAYTNQPHKMQTYSAILHPGFFCRQERKLEKKVKLPVVFRLGDIDQVDRLEGKRPIWIQ